MEYLSGDKAFEATQNVFLGEPFGESALHVVNGSGIVSEPDDSDHVERTIGFPVTTTMESHPVTLP